MLQVHHNCFLWRIDHDSLRCVNNIVENMYIVERFARLIVARRRVPREPLALATQAALRDSLQELAIEEAKPRRHRVVYGADNIFFRSLSSRLRSILFFHPHAPIFWNIPPSDCSRSMLGSTDFVGTRRNQEEEEEEALAPCAMLSSWLSCSFLLSAHPNIIIGWALHSTYGLWRSWRCYHISFSFVPTLIARQSASISLSLLPYCFALILRKIVWIGIFIV